MKLVGERLFSCKLLAAELGFRLGRGGDDKKLSFSLEQTVFTLSGSGLVV